MALAMAASERDWRAESDLHTLIEAEKIKRDQKRLRAAMKKRKEMEKDLDRVGGGDDD